MQKKVQKISIVFTRKRCSLYSNVVCRNTTCLTRFVNWFEKNIPEKSRKYTLWHSGRLNLQTSIKKKLHKTITFLLCAIRYFFLNYSASRWKNNLHLSPCGFATAIRANVVNGFRHEWYLEPRRKCDKFKYLLDIKKKTIEDLQIHTAFEKVLIRVFVEKFTYQRLFFTELKKNKIYKYE